jgi:UDP-N-acetylglucosamine/UDP-N-acetylgalactosamine diphosphorylase
MESIDDLRRRYEAAGQGHLFTFWAKLSEEEQESLATQLETIDIQRVNRIYNNAISSESRSAGRQDPIDPLPQEASDSAVGAPEKEKEWRSVGLSAIARGEVGVLLMAGGQGTRLGSSAPKGCYDIGLPSHKSLFQYQAERIARLQTVAETENGLEPGSAIIPWYVMVSGPTRRETEQFFLKNSYFGLNAEHVIFFEQGTKYFCVQAFRFHIRRF